MDSTLALPLDHVVVVQQIQALAANVQKLMKQNKELKCQAHAKGSNASHHQLSYSRHDKKARNPENNKGKDTTEYTG